MNEIIVKEVKKRIREYADEVGESDINKIKTTAALERWTARLVAERLPER